MIAPWRAARRLWFAARKLRLPVPRGALVLEVGSGDSPCPRSDVLFDMTLENHERVGGETICDRLLILGIVEQLPFRDKAFDYVIAFHVLEHSPTPAKFLRELERVARAGYIETPAFWLERINPLTMHRLEVGIEPFEQGQRLVINQKPAAIPEPTLAAQFQQGPGPPDILRHNDPNVLVTKYHWREHVNFRVINPELRITWEPPPEVTRAGFHDPRPLVRRFLKWAAQKTRRHRPIDLLALLRCVDCGHAPLHRPAFASISCPVCSRRYEVVNQIPHMYPLDTGVRTRPSAGA